MGLGGVGRHLRQRREASHHGGGGVAESRAECRVERGGLRPRLRSRLRDLAELRSREELEVELGRRAEGQQAVAAEGALQGGGA